MSGRKTLVEEGTQFKGSMSSDCPIEVKGRIEGDLAPTPEGFWAAELPSRTLQVWDHLNSLGRDYYATTFRPLLERDSR